LTSRSKRRRVPTRSGLHCAVAEHRPQMKAVAIGLINPSSSERPCGADSAGVDQCELRRRFNCSAACRWGEVHQHTRREFPARRQRIHRWWWRGSALGVQKVKTRALLALRCARLNVARSERKLRSKLRGWRHDPETRGPRLAWQRRCWWLFISPPRNRDFWNAGVDQSMARMARGGFFGSCSPAQLRRADPVIAAKQSRSSQRKPTWLNTVRASCLSTRLFSTTDCSRSSERRRQRFGHDSFLSVHCHATNFQPGPNDLRNRSGHRRSGRLKVVIQSGED